MADLTTVERETYLRWLALSEAARRVGLSVPVHGRRQEVVPFFQATGWQVVAFHDKRNNSILVVRRDGPK